MVVIGQAKNEDFRAALGHILYRPGIGADQLDSQVDALLRYGEKYKLSLEQCVVAKEGGRIVSACLSVDSPGRISAVFLPRVRGGHTDREALVCLLRESERQGKGRNLLYLQGIVGLEEQEAIEVYREAGFSFLARLIYMENDLARPILADKRIPELSWVVYDEHTHGLFAEVIQQTYEGSLDCARLSGVRGIEDILAAHRSTGEFNSRRWYVGMVDSRPVGVVLLAYIAERYVFEVVYMGLVPEYRRKGFGLALLAKAVEAGREEGVDKLTLTVDEVNKPALWLYQRLGFEEVSRREAWIYLYREHGDGL